jgi:uncharacterized membrane protein
VSAEPRGAPLPGPPRWLPFTTTALALGGLGVSSYLTAAHFATGIALACPESGLVNCEKVTTSPQSEVFGIPVAVLGLVFFAAMVVLDLPAAWRSERPGLAALRLGAATVGMGFAIYLVSVELLVVDAICLWCTSVHVLTFALFVLVVAGSAQHAPPLRRTTRLPELAGRRP